MRKVLSVSPLSDYKLLVVFDNQIQKIYDASELVTKGIFRKLQDISLFNQVSIAGGAVAWFEEWDLDPDMIYQESKPLDV